jgi:hypothetical protein
MQSNTNGRRRRRRKKSSPRKKRKRSKAPTMLSYASCAPLKANGGLQSQAVKNNGIAKAQKRNNAKKSSMLSSSLTVQLSNTEPNQRHRSPKGKQGA